MKPLTRCCLVSLLEDFFYWRWCIQPRFDCFKNKYYKYFKNKVTLIIAHSPIGYEAVMSISFDFLLGKGAERVHLPL